MNTNTKLLISVIICTYRRPDMLYLALQGLVGQTISKEYFEVIVVDNNSNDNTQSISDSFLKQLPLRYVNEVKQGLSHARNRGVYESKGQYLAFLDDDAIPEKSWLETARVLLSSLTEEYDCIGGPILPFYTSEKPTWFKDEYETRSWGKTPRYLDLWQGFAGSNMIWRKDTILELGGFDVALGMTGENLALGEETKLFFALWKQRPTAKVYYLPELKIKHWTPIEKMDIEYQKKRNIAKGVSSYYIHRATWPFLKRAIWFIKLIGGILIFSVLALVRRYRYPNRNNWFMEEWRKVIVWYVEFLMILGIRSA